MEEKIELTPQELEDIKDDIRFKEKTTLTLKHLCGKVDKLNGIKDKVTSLQIHRVIHWILLLMILGILFRVQWMMK